MSKIDARRSGELGMHVVSFQDMALDKWVKGFNSLDEVKHALNDKDGFLQRVPSQASQIKQALVGLKEQMERDTVGGEQLQQNTIPVTTIQEGTHRPEPRHVAPNVVHTIDAQIQNRIETIITDKGVFFHIDALKERLSVFTDDEQLFMKACADAGVDIFTEYVSETAKKKIATSVQKLTKESE